MQNATGFFFCSHYFVISICFHIFVTDMYNRESNASRMDRTSTNRNAKIQTAFRFEPLLLDRVKEAAKQKGVSVNEYVSNVLVEATKEILTEKEMEERRRETEEFLEKVAGKWVDEGSTEEIMKRIREGRKPWKIREW